MDRLLRGLEQIGSFLPALVASGVILLVGYFFARQLQRFSDRLLHRFEFDRMAKAGGLDEMAQRAGAAPDAAGAVGKLLFWLVMLMVILLASSALGLQSVNDLFTTMLSFVPTVMVAIFIIILGMLVGEFVRGLVLASAGEVPGVPTLAKVAKGVVVMIAIFMSLQQLGVAADIVTAAFTLILGAVALAVGLAFGLGNTQLAGEITRKWYEEGRHRNRRKTDRPASPPAGADGQLME